MLLMIGLAIMGSLVLVNLIVAIIVSDIEMLRKQAHLQETINKAQHVVFIESLMPNLPKWCSGSKCCSRKKRCEQEYDRQEAENRILICPHNMCR